MKRILILVLALLALAIGSPISASPAGALPTCTNAVVTKVVDGDTIRVIYGGFVRPVRYQGMNAPEDTKIHEPWGPEATAYNATLTPVGSIVCLERDVTDVDIYGRLLRYIWLADGRMADEELLLAGLAKTTNYPADVKYRPRLLAAEAVAQSGHLGVWSVP